MTPQKFVTSLQTITPTDTFNPYSQTCSSCDKQDAPARRSAMLLKMVSAAAQTELDSLWVGRDLGYRGGRRTGMALTDDVHIAAHAERWQIEAKRPTKGAPVAERTAAVIWRILSVIETPIFLWNVFPLHPHEPDDPFTNRAHNRRERRDGESILEALILLLNPRRLVAVGNDAAVSLKRLAPDREILVFRHPSYGGQTQFLSQARSAYSCFEQRSLL
jgi:uracil-DNA glycosylase